MCIYVYLSIYLSAPAPGGGLAVRGPAVHVDAEGGANLMNSLSLSINMCVCIYIYISIDLSLYLYIYVYIYIYIHIVYTCLCWFLPKAEQTFERQESLQTIADVAFNVQIYKHGELATDCGFVFQR